MRTKIEISIRKLLAVVQVLGRFINESQVTGIPVKVRYWLGRNYDRLQKEVDVFEIERKKLVAIHGDVIAVRREKLDLFFGTMFPEIEINTFHPVQFYMTTSKELGMPLEILNKIRTEYPELNEKIDKWIKTNPGSTEKEVITADKMPAFRKDLEELMDVKVEIEITTISLDKVAHLSDNSEFGTFVSQTIILWNEDSELEDEQTIKRVK